jgi:hypothetical protein
LSAKTSTALSAPANEGENVTLTVHVPAAANVVPHVLDEIPKSAPFVPLIVMLAILRVALPVFVSVVAIGAEVVDTATEPKAMLVGENPAPACVPAP